MSNTESQTDFESQIRLH